jgi:integrase
MPETLDFTLPRLAALPSPLAGRALYYDSDVAGLVCRVTAAGSKCLWFTRWAANGQRWMKIGDPGRLAVKDARSLARQLSGRIDAGERPWEERAQARTDATVDAGALWESYLAGHALPHKRPKSVATDCWLWARVLAPAFKVRYLTACDGHPGAEVTWAAKGEDYDQRADRRGQVVAGTKHTRERFPCPTCGAKVAAVWTGGRLAADITREQVERLHKTITDERGATLANRAVVLLQTMFAKSAPDLANPAANSGSYRHKEASRDRHMAAVEIGWFWEAVEQEPQPWPAFFAIAATTGARKSNILAMPWPTEQHKEINLTTGEWKVPAFKSKGGESMTLFLAQPICDRLREWRKECASKVWIFPHADDPKRHAVEPSRAWDRVRWRMEALRLLTVLAALEHWTPQRQESEIAGLPELAERFWRAALGRHESSDKHPLHRVVESLQERVQDAGGEPSEGSVLDIRFHDIRRSVGAHAAMAGHSEAEIGRLLGHAPGSKSTRIYGRIGRDHAANMAAMTAARMLGHNVKAAGRVLGIGSKS